MLFQAYRASAISSYFSLSDLECPSIASGVLNSEPADVIDALPRCVCERANEEIRAARVAPHCLKCAWHARDSGIQAFLPATRSGTLAWILMLAFGIVVVLLLLNLLIARFAKTFDMVYENLDEVSATV